MLQRIQTVYLLLAALFVSFMFMMPLGEFIAGGTDFSLNAFGLFELKNAETAEAVKILDRTITGILIIIAAILPVITIFLYKKRKLQNKLCILEGVILLVLQGLVIYNLFVSKEFISQEVGQEIACSYSLLCIAPIIAFVFTILAKRGVMKDERLVRSMDRFR